MTNQTTHPRLTEDEQEAFEGVLSVMAANADNDLPEYFRLALVRVSLDDKPEAVIALVDESSDDDDVFVRPLAVLVSDSLIERMVQP